MKIALAQINPVIGDFTHNARLVVSRAEEAKRQGCDLVVFSELVLCGYPPQDLLERSSFLADHDAVFEEIVQNINGISVILGVLGRHTGSTGKPLHNCAVLFRDGKVEFVTRKRLLPSYDVFDETRYFEPGTANTTMDYQGLNIAVTICEDIWNDKDVFGRPLYSDDPVAEIISAAGTAGRKIDLMINLSASPYHIGKNKQRYNIFSKVCAKHGFPLIYVNQVGGQDSLLFDGNSLVLDNQGEVLVQGKQFQDDLVLFDWNEWQKNRPPSSSLKHKTESEKKAVAVGSTVNVSVSDDDIGAVFDALTMGVRDYVGKCGFSKGLLGLSGGIDSSLTAAIACKALGPQNVMGIAMPSPYTSSESIEDAKLLSENLGCHFEIISITSIFETFLNTLDPVFAGYEVDVTEQNLQARVRGSLLMALSNKFGFLLLSTGNKSEMAVGYCTLYGDMSGGLAVIADVPKMLVYQLAGYVNRKLEIIPRRVVEKAPSAELAPNQLDQDDLPPYEVLDPILAAYLEENMGMADIVERGFDREIVEDVLRRIRINEYKRKQAPIALKVTTKSFGPGRRYPTAQNYRERISND